MRDDQFTIIADANTWMPQLINTDQIVSASIVGGDVSLSLNDGTVATITGNGAHDLFMRLLNNHSVGLSGERPNTLIDAIRKALAKKEVSI